MAAVEWGNCSLDVVASAMEHSKTPGISPAFYPILSSPHRGWSRRLCDYHLVYQYHLGGVEPGVLGDLELLPSTWFIGMQVRPKQGLALEVE